MIDKLLRYRNTRPCDHEGCNDIKFIKAAICYTDAFGYLCEEHWQLAMIAGFKPILLPIPDETTKILMDASDELN